VSGSFVWLNRAADEREQEAMQLAREEDRTLD
jgi:hypothetical protein